MSDNREPLDLDELRRVAEAATPGSWSVDTNTPFSDDLVGIFVESAKRYVVQFDDQDPSWCDNPVTRADAAYIAAMDPPTTLALLAEVVALREQVARVRALHIRSVLYGWEDDDGVMECGTCDVAWPCPTVAALDAAGDPT